MCTKGSFLFCFPVQTACLVLAIINVIINILVSLFFLLFWGIFFVFIIASTPSFGLVVIFMMVPVVGLLNVIFTSLLCHGICERQPKLVKTFFWYGVVTTIPLTIAAVAMFCYDHKSYDPQVDFESYLQKSDSATGGLLLLIGCVYHSLFLVLVHFTHKKLLQDCMANDHIILVERRDCDDVRLVIDRIK